VVQQVKTAGGVEAELREAQVQRVERDLAGLLRRPLLLLAV